MTIHVTKYKRSRSLQGFIVHKFNTNKSVKIVIINDGNVIRSVKTHGVEIFQSNGHVTQALDLDKLLSNECSVELFQGTVLPYVNDIVINYLTATENLNDNLPLQEIVFIVAVALKMVEVTMV